MSIQLVVNNAAFQGCIGQVVYHLGDLVFFDALTEHGSHLLLAETMACGCAHGVLEGVA